MAILKGTRLYRDSGRSNSCRRLAGPIRSSQRRPEEEAFLNAAVQEFEGEPVRVMLAEHLVAIMLKVGRLKDSVRAQMFFSQQAVDRDLLLDINRHGLEKQWADFQTKGLQ